MKTMSPREVAQTLGVHLDWVYRLLRVGKLGGRKVSNRGKSVWVISLEAVKALQEERKEREKREC